MPLFSIKSTSSLILPLPQVSSFQMEAEAVIYSDDAPNRAAIEALLETAASVDVEFEEVPRLKQLLAQAQWLEKVLLILKVLARLLDKRW